MTIFTKSLLLCLLTVMAPIAVRAQVWTVLTFDIKGDARDSSLADAAQLAYRYDKQQDYLWFRIALYGQPNQQAFGINLVFDTGSDDASKMNWWGANNTFKFDKLLTAWVTHNDKGYAGTIGIGDAQGARAKQFNNLHQNDLQIQVDGDSIVIGVKRTDITDKLKMNVVAAVGSNERWNDDLPNVQSVPIDLSAERSKRGLREIDSSHNNFAFPVTYKTLKDERAPVITRHGQGQQTLILIPGMYSGATSFAGFVARNQQRYKLFVMTPPGLNGTPAREMPAAGASFGELSWTRQLERDVVNLIQREKLTKPVIVAEGHPGSVAAIELAISHQERIGGVVLVATGLVQSFYSPKDPTRKTPIDFAERPAFVDEAWGAKWFRYVTDETWNSNDLPATLLSNEPSRSEQAWQQIEAAPLAVKIRYLCEFWASDVRHDFAMLNVPVLALIPGFDEKFLADPLNGFAKNSIVGSWETQIPKHPLIELVKIPDARMLLFDDQPKLADEALIGFLRRISEAREALPLLH